MNSDSYKSLFISEFYNPVYQEWRVDQLRAGKDVVGHYYESFRTKIYESVDGLRVLGRAEKKELFPFYDADIVVVNSDNEVVVIEEDKAHYVDKCFLKRAVGNFAELVLNLTDKGIEVPYLVLSSSTTYSGFERVMNEFGRVFNPEIMDVVREKMVYSRVCEHDRVPAKHYFANSESSFTLSDELVENEVEFINKLA